MALESLYHVYPRKAERNFQPTGKIRCSSVVLKESLPLNFQGILFFPDLNMCMQGKMLRHLCRTTARWRVGVPTRSCPDLCEAAKGREETTALISVRGEHFGYFLSIGGSSCLHWADAARIPNLALSDTARKTQRRRRRRRRMTRRRAEPEHRSCLLPPQHGDN